MLIMVGTEGICWRILVYLNICYCIYSVFEFIHMTLLWNKHFKNEGQRSEEGLTVCSHHAGTFLSPCEREWRVPRPFAVQSDVGVHIHREWFGLHYQYWADWKEIIHITINTVTIPTHSVSHKSHTAEGSLHVTHSARPPGCWRWCFPRRWTPDTTPARWRRSDPPWWRTRSHGPPPAAHHL